MTYSKRLFLFEQIMVKHSSFLTSALWKLTNSRELFEEAMQNALLSMWRNVEKLSGKRASAYIYRIAMTANSSAWRNRMGRNPHIRDAQNIHEAETHSIDDDIVLDELIRKAISMLSPQQSRAIVMRYLEQKEYLDIAQTLRCSEAGARSHVSKALEKLKNNISSLTKWKKRQ